MIKPVKKFKFKSKSAKQDANSWLTENFEYVVDNFAGGYVVIVDGKGILYTDADGPPDKIVKRAKREFPKTPPLFFRVPHPQDFSCALITA